MDVEGLRAGIREAEARIRSGSLSNKEVVALVGEVVDESTKAVSAAEKKGDSRSAADVCWRIRTLLGEAADVVDDDSSETFAVAATYWAMRAQYLEGQADMESTYRPAKVEPIPKKQRLGSRLLRAEAMMKKAAGRSSSKPSPVERLSSQSTDSLRGPVELWGSTAQRNSRLQSSRIRFQMGKEAIGPRPTGIPEWLKTRGVGEAPKDWRNAALGGFEGERTEKTLKEPKAPRWK